MRPLATATALAALLALCGAPAPASAPSRADELFAGRADPAKLEAAAEAYESAGAHVMAARACFLRIDLHADLVADEDARERWIDRGLAAAAKALGADVDVDEVEDALPKLQKPHAEALYWFAALWGRKTELAWKLKQPGMAKRFLRLAERAAELDETVYFGGPRRLIGSYCASAPGFLGGDDERAARELGRAVALAPDFFETRVLRAEKVHLPRGERAAFAADLKHVIDAREDVLPEIVPEQRRQKEEARKLLSKG